MCGEQSHDLHSGGFGGIVHNPALALAQIISKMHNPDNSIAVPGFYDDVLSLSDEERAELKKNDILEDTLREFTDVPKSWGEEGYTLRERQSARPTLEDQRIVERLHRRRCKNSAARESDGENKLPSRLESKSRPHL